MSNRTPEEHEADFRFEEDVRRTAEAVFNLQPGQCKPEWYSKNPVVQELDGLARCREVTHLIMATRGRSLAKVEKDVTKLLAAEKVERAGGQPTKKWLITAFVMGAEHVKYARNHQVECITLHAFRDRFFNSHNYISKRSIAPFGSARNPGDNSITLPQDEYIPLPMFLTEDRNGALTRALQLSVHDLTLRLRSGETLVLLAPFGAGKSLTVREVFFRIADQYSKDEPTRVPLALNLREHWGAKFADEALIRHGREIAYDPPNDLVAAYRGGLLHLLLDGFDELASQGVVDARNRQFMRSARNAALQAVRDLIDKVPAGTGVLIAGRDHYFDDVRELTAALGIQGKPYSLIRLGEFGEDEAEAYLKRKGVSHPLPDWLPRKPLLLGYLASKELLATVVAIDAAKGFGHAWDSFLDQICAREAQHAGTALDSHSLRHILERLAMDVRATSAGNGPISSPDLADAYVSETAQTATEAVLMQLQRLPGLTPRDADPSTRSFVDDDLLAALQGSALARYLTQAQRNWNTNRAWLAPLSQRAISIAAYLLDRERVKPGTVIATATRLASKPTAFGQEQQLAADCLEIAIEMARDDGALDCQGLAISGAVIGSLPLEEMSLLNLSVDESYVEEVRLGPGIASSGLRIKGTAIDRVTGITEERALPAGIFQGVSVEVFDDHSTNAAVVRSSLQPPMKALITILRKLYLQSGGGRQLKALKRGLPPGPIAASVDDVLDILVEERVVEIANEVVHPVRRQAGRIQSILASEALSEDTIVRAVRKLNR